jgi:hypothetical protein
MNPPSQSLWRGRQRSKYEPQIDADLRRWESWSAASLARPTGVATPSRFTCARTSSAHRKWARIMIGLAHHASTGGRRNVTALRCRPLSASQASQRSTIPICVHLRVLSLSLASWRLGVRFLLAFSRLFHLGKGAHILYGRFERGFK